MLIRISRLSVLLAGCLALGGLVANPYALAQGSLAPASAPGATFKTLDQARPGQPIPSLDSSSPLFSAPYLIDTPGSYYLTEDLYGDGTNPVIEILPGHAGTTLDLNGFTIHATGNEAAAVQAAGRVRVSNGRISGDFQTGLFGVDFVRNVTIHGADNGIQGTRLVTDTRVSGVESIAVSSSGAILHGNTFADGSVDIGDGSIVIDNSISPNSDEDGLVAGTGVFVDNRIIYETPSSSEVHGMEISGTSVVSNNVIHNSPGIGIATRGLAAVVGNFVRSPDGNGFEGEGGLWVDNNVLLGGAGGIISTGPGSVHGLVASGTTVGIQFADSDTPIGRILIHDSALSGFESAIEVGEESKISEVRAIGGGQDFSSPLRISHSSLVSESSFQNFGSNVASSDHTWFRAVNFRDFDAPSVLFLAQVDNYTFVTDCTFTDVNINGIETDADYLWAEDNFFSDLALAVNGSEDVDRSIVVGNRAADISVDFTNLDPGSNIIGETDDSFTDSLSVSGNYNLLQP